MKFAAIFLMIPVMFAQCSRMKNIPVYQDNGRNCVVEEEILPAVIEEPPTDTVKTTLESDEGAPVPTQLVRGRVMVVGQYCGGAYPSDEILEAVQTPRPLADYPVMIRMGSDNKGEPNGRWLLKTDAEGYWEVKLSAGDYCLVAGEKTKSNPQIPQSQPGFLEVNAKCYAEWLETCDQTFHVGFEPMKEDVKLMLYAKCFVTGYDPCSHYSGPMPP